MRNYLIIIAIMLFSDVVNGIEMQGQLTQGGLIRGQVPANTKLWLNEQPVQVSKEGYFAFGFGRDAKLEQKLGWQEPGRGLEQVTLKLAKREYDVQRIDGLPSKMVSPPKEVLARIKQDNRMVGQARRTNDARLDFMQDFIWPAEGRISGVYGSQRVLNGQPKRPHFGVDVANKVGTPVYAPAAGIVTLYVPDMYYSGGTMIIDHGMGVSSTFLHLNKGHVEVGDQVKQGQLVAEIGDTGRVTGAHLDWRINWFKQRLDPALLVPKRE